MKKYTKPTVEVVNLKSSNDIATSTFKQIKKGFIQNYLLDNTTDYAVSQYSNYTSVTAEVTEG